MDNKVNVIKINKQIDPMILKYWDYTENKGIRIDQIKAKDSYYWICPECNYRWKTRVGRLIYETKGCPNCKKIAKKQLLNIKNGLVINDEKLMKEWDYDINNLEGIYPDKLSIKSKEKANWICQKHHHKWKSSIYNRVFHKRNCPYCSNQKILRGYNDLATINPKLAQEWDYDKNKKSPYEIGAGTKLKYWWKCEKGHEWEASVDNRNRNNVGCPYCSQSISFPEKALYFYLKNILRE